MPRPKKDGRYINYYIDRQLFEAVEAYAQGKRYSLTTAIEVLLEKGLGAEIPSDWFASDQNNEKSD